MTERVSVAVTLARTLVLMEERDRLRSEYESVDADIALLRDRQSTARRMDERRRQMTKQATERRALLAKRSSILDSLRIINRELRAIEFECEAVYWREFMFAAKGIVGDDQFNTIRAAAQIRIDEQRAHRKSGRPHVGVEA